MLREIGKTREHKHVESDVRKARVQWHGHEYGHDEMSMATPFVPLVLLLALFALTD